MRTVSVRLPEGLWEALAAGAEREKRSLNRQVHFILEGWARGVGLYPGGEEPRAWHEVHEGRATEALPAVPEGK